MSDCSYKFVSLPVTETFQIQGYTKPFFNNPGKAFKTGVSFHVGKTDPGFESH